MKTSGHADTRVVHVVLHRRVHRVMMLGRTCERERGFFKITHLTIAEGRCEGAPGRGPSRALTHWRAEARVEGLVVEVEVPGGFDHVAHHSAQAQAVGLLLFTLGRELAVPRLDAFLLHRQRSVHLQHAETTNLLESLNLRFKLHNSRPG